ncbi:MAG: Flp/Fap pilin component [Schlesneria sp.]|nr:Flp/Fap pilin component [Schlesneria sp.]
MADLITIPTSSLRVKAMRRWTRFLREESGTTSVEYSVMLGFIITVVIAAVAAFGSGQNKSWNGIDNQLQSHGF